jgi:hypothetical protein
MQLRSNDVPRIKLRIQFEDPNLWDPAKDGEQLAGLWFNQATNLGELFDRQEDDICEHSEFG